MKLSNSARSVTAAKPIRRDEFPARELARDLRVMSRRWPRAGNVSRRGEGRDLVDRCAVFVDAGYVLADGAMAVHGTRQRDSVSWDYAGLVKLLTGLSRDRTGLPVLRCYWYEATVEGRRSSEHDALADLPGVKLRLGRMRPGRREGVEAEMHRDLITLARNHAVSDAVIVSAEEDLAEVVAEVQDFGLRVLIVHITADGTWTVSRPLRQECDDIVEISGAHLRPFVDLIAGAEPAGHDDQYRNGSYPSRGHERRGISNGHGPGLGAVTHHGLPAAALPASPAIYTAPVVEEYQRTAQPPGQGQGALASSAAHAAPRAQDAPPSAAHPPAAQPQAVPQPPQDQGASPNPAAARPAAASRNPAGAQDPAAAQAPATAAQALGVAPPQAAHHAPETAHQAPEAAHQAPAAAQFPAAAQGPAAQPLPAPVPPAEYGAQHGDHIGDHVRAHATSQGRRGSPAAQPPAPHAVPQAPVPPAAVPPTQVPPAPVPPAPAQQAPAPPTQVPPAPVPPPHVPQALAPRAAMPASASPPPGAGETRFGSGQGDYRLPGPPGQRALPAREAMAAPGQEAARPPGHGAQFAENSPPGRFAGDPDQGRFAEAPPPGRFAEGQAASRFAEGVSPAQYQPGPAGAYGAGGAAPVSYPQFPGSPPGQ